MQLTNVSEIIAAFAKQLHVQRKRIDGGKHWIRTPRSLVAINFSVFKYRIAPPAKLSHAWVNVYADPMIGTFRSGFVNPSWNLLTIKRINAI